MGKIWRLLIIALLCMILVGCSAKSKSFVIPDNYTGEALMKVYTDKTENSYKVSLIHRDGNSNFSINDGDMKWNVAFLNDGRCILSNELFSDSSVNLENFKLMEVLSFDFDFSKFKNDLEELPQELVYWDGTYKHILSFNKESLLPESILIYKNENLVKAIQYDKINVEYNEE